MQTSVIDLLVPTEIQVEDINETTSKITLEPLEAQVLSLKLFH